MFVTALTPRIVRLVFMIPKGTIITRGKYDGKPTNFTYQICIGTYYVYVINDAELIHQAKQWLNILWVVGFRTK